MSRSAAALAGLVGAVCGLCAAPGLTWLDGGELAASAAELGVAHPPGFPLFVLIHHAIMLLVPLGDVVFRGNLASAICAAAAAVAVVGAARSLGARTPAAVAGGVLFALTPGLLLHGTTVEVYTGAAGLTAAGVWLTMALHRSADPRLAVALGLGVGLAAGHHAELRLFVLLLIPFFLAEVRRDRRAASLALAAAVLGTVIIVYLPLRAAAEPWRNWGDPSTAAALWDHLTGARIRAAFADRFGAVDLRAMAHFVEQLVSTAPILLLAGLAGFARAARVSGGWLVPVAWLVDALYATALNPMGLEDGQNGLPGMALLGIGAALGIDAVAGRMGEGRRGPILVTTVVLAAAAWVAPHLELYRTDRGLDRVIDRVADDLPPEALVLVAGDNLAAGFAARQIIYGTRPDLAVIVRQHVRYPSSVEPVRRRLPDALAGWSPGAGLKALERLSGGWPIAWEWANGLDAGARPDGLAPRFPLFVRPAMDSATIDALVPDAEVVGLGRQGRRGLANWLSDRGRVALIGGRIAESGAAFARALEVEPEESTRWNNVATALAAAGRYDEARQAAAKAVEIDPGNTIARLNLARYALHAGDAETARAELDVLVVHAPSADALALRGVVRGNAGDLKGAAADFTAALTRDPQQPEARAGMDRLRRMAPAP